MKSPYISQKSRTSIGPSLPFSLYNVSLNFLAMFIRVFFVVAMKCPATFAIFADFFRFLQAISTQQILPKLREKFASKFLLHLAILVEFVILAIFAIFSIHF